MAIDIDEFDFGFTAVDETELEAVQQSAETVNSAQTAALNNEEKLNKLYNAIQPLLSNLKKNPEKEYILWPNRTEKIEQFEDLIRKIISDQHNNKSVVHTPYLIIKTLRAPMYYVGALFLYWVLFMYK